MRNRILLLTLSILTLIFILIASFSIVKVDNSNMEAAYLKGEKLLINKLYTGFKIPFTNITIFHYWDISENDIISFHYPKLFDVSLKEKDLMVSRCVGLPGDTLQLKDKNLFIDNHMVHEPVSLQFRFRLVAQNDELDKTFFEKYGITEYKQVHEAGIYNVLSTRKLSTKIGEDSEVSNIRLLNIRNDRNSPVIFPFSMYYAFSKDNLGPVVIPFEGWTVKINIRNIGLYKTIIEHYEGNSIEIKDNSVFLNAKIIDKYTFLRNYYFVLDDNRDSADDSRHWGFLPEDHITGVVVDI